MNSRGAARPRARPRCRGAVLRPKLLRPQQPSVITLYSFDSSRTASPVRRRVAGLRHGHAPRHAPGPSSSTRDTPTAPAHRHLARTRLQPPRREILPRVQASTSPGRLETRPCKHAAFKPPSPGSLTSRHPRRHPSSRMPRQVRSRPTSRPDKRVPALAEWGSGCASRPHAGQ